MSTVTTVDIKTVVTDLGSSEAVETISNQIVATVNQSVSLVETSESGTIIETVSQSRVVDNGPSASSGSGLSQSEVEALIEEALVFQNYQINDVDTVSTTTYIGKAKLDGTWLIERIVESGDDLAKDYANESNNSGVSTYASGWSNRLTLTFGEIQTLTGV